ncbi:hypothetical protein HGM15179_004429 [Zosterops borbonicus]|uniref:Uncharacterized protein n=1 Tax=Zosterops borbonicus TaxID=364589 RepID=A0A8K1GRT2_9PASS|nr:hypothetical protein HGM15179_004429 [Zosterops borbonicus]
MSDGLGIQMDRTVIFFNICGVAGLYYAAAQGHQGPAATGIVTGEMIVLKTSLKFRWDKALDVSMRRETSEKRREREEEKRREEKRREEKRREEKRREE